MPSKKHYDLVSNDDFDSRIPLHTEEAFQHGITFQAKFIGGLDIPRPTTRLEIVSAMRRARYEFKARGIKKKKVILEVSVDGLKISMRRKKKKKEPSDSEESKLLLMHHPIYRIFYVSHDSQDLKIFSYIARDTSSNMFRCNVFKTNKKTQAMRIVRTVGQAFEVCHKLNTPTSADDATADEKEGGTESGSEEQGSDTHSVTDKPKKDYADMNGSDKIYDSSALTVTQSQLSILADPPPPQPVENYPRPVKLDLFTSSEAKRTSTGDVCLPASTPLALQHEVQLLREQLEQQQQQTHAALAQVHLLRDQLAAETAARMEAQARTHQLLVHNRELLDHIQTLVLQMQELETKLGPSPNCQISASQLPNPASTNGKLPILSEMDLPASDVHLIENPRARDSSTCESIALGLQQQLQQQQQQYALMLAQVGQQMNFLPPLALYNNFGALAAAAVSSPYNLSYSALSPPPPHTPRLNPLGQFANLGSYGNPMTSPPPPGLANNNNSNNINNANLANFYSTAQSSPPSQSMNTNFILPLAELEASNASTYPLNLPPIANNRSADHMRQFQDAVNPTASVNSLSSDSDRQRFDSKNSSSLESMSPTVSQRAGLPSLHQQLEHMRMGGAGCSTTDAEDRDRLSTLRRNGPFITRSTSEKVPHRNEILAQTLPAAKVEEWLRQQSILRPESGYAEESAEPHQNQLRDLELHYNNSATESPVLEPKEKKPKWKFLSRKSSWRSF